MKNAKTRSARSTTRRRLLQQLATIAAGSLLSDARSHAAEAVPAHAQGMQRVRGNVQVDGARARTGTIVRPGATVTTGRDSEAAYVIGSDAFLQKAGSRVEIGAAATVFRVITGGLLSVFGRGAAKTIQTSVVTAGIRGTGCYIEVDARRTYFCLCYGSVELSPAGGQAQSYTTRHHDSPFWIADGGVTPGDMRGHTDEELQYLESLVGRQVPFASPYKK